MSNDDAIFFYNREQKVFNLIRGVFPECVGSVSHVVKNYLYVSYELDGISFSLDSVLFLESHGYDEVKLAHKVCDFFVRHKLDKLSGQ